MCRISNSDRQIVDFRWQIKDSPLKSKTVNNIFEAVCPQLLKWDNNDILFRTITTFLFIPSSFSKKDKFYENQIKSKTNMHLVIALRGIRSIIQDFKIENYKALDYYFVAKKSKGKTKMYDGAIPEKAIPPKIKLN